MTHSILTRSRFAGLTSALALSMSALVGAAQADGRTSIFFEGEPYANVCSAGAKIAEHDSITTRNACERALQTGFLTPWQEAGTHVNLGIIEMRRGDTSAALAAFETAREIEPDMPNLSLNISSALIREGRFAEAADVLDKLDDVSDTQRPAALYNRAVARMELNQLSAAYGDLQAALALKPDYANAQALISRFNISGS